MNKLTRALLILFTLHSISACSGTLLPVRTIYNSTQCATTKPGMSALSTQQELDEAINTHQPVFSEKQAQAPRPDFDNESVVLLALGQQNTAGHNIVLSGKQAQIKNNQLVLPVTISSPEPGSMQAQVITSPCLILVLPKSDFSEIVLEAN